MPIKTSRLGVSSATVYGLLMRGQLPHIRVPNVIRFAAADLDTAIIS